jgi:hypothetical protein
LQSERPAGRVAELGSLGVRRRHIQIVTPRKGLVHN